MNKSLNCKMCHRPITVEINDDYASMGDPNKLLALATCNICYDYREKRKRIESGIGKICRMIQCTPPKARAEFITTVVGSLQTLTKLHNTAVAGYFLCTNYWDEEMVQMMTDKPEHWGNILSMTVKMLRQHPLPPP